MSWSFEKAKLQCYYKNFGGFASLDLATNKTQEECNKCGGSYKALNEWRSSQALSPDRYKLFKIIPILFTFENENENW